MMLFLVVVTLSVARCGGSPVQPTATVLAPVPTIPTAAASVPVWPVPHADGAFGHEDPRYPPDVALCPVAYWPHYNGWNWLCQGGYPWLREFPSTRWRAPRRRRRRATRGPAPRRFIEQAAV